MLDRLEALSSPIFALQRSDISEVVVSGLYVWSMNGDPIHSSKNARQSDVCMRSLAKPWQFLATAPADFHQDWLLAVSSHSGEPEHIRRLERLLTYEGISREALLCPAAMPMHDLSAIAVRAKGGLPDAIYHPCSGKHAYYVAAARAFQSELSYLSEQHPLHLRLIKELDDFGVQARYLTDSCRLPAVVTSAQDIARLWHFLAIDDRPSAQKLLELWSTQPEVVGGTDRLDSLICELGQRQLIAKEGADGLLMVQSIAAKYPTQSVFIKLASGYNKNHLALALYSVLNRCATELTPPFAALLETMQTRLEQWFPRDQHFVPLCK